MKSWATLVGSARPRRGLTKSQAERQHARRRASERYGIDFNSHSNKALITQIQNGTATFVQKQSHRISVWDVWIQGVTARVVYDKDRKQIVTFLPLHRQIAPESVTFLALDDDGMGDYIAVQEVLYQPHGEEIVA